jgi:hypothetical protein
MNLCHSSSWMRVLKFLGLGCPAALALIVTLSAALPLAAQEMTEEVVEEEETLCEELPAAQQLGEVIANKALEQAAQIGTLLGEPSATTLADSILDREVMEYWETKAITSGTKYTADPLQGHHLLEQRFIDQWGKAAGKSAEEIEQLKLKGPSIVVREQEHIMINRTISSQDGVLPCGKEYDKATVLGAYNQLYQHAPNWLAAIEQFILDAGL